ncbi:hypothetical protein NF27_CG01740 [Candidatus Jidaibacter acanthamoeba]|uniref:Uncharacterized protein n=1 Tax=Candidatus Jidaibacter acanthamoebae TaxID=86105 RepID=A0A0C1QKH5_9RICK|nr:hypothetical protein [Candidatus Jidaibacter acanthamoeba]KIE05994.1 hypothetical protein NF27_CG01740 [Candidatus Jidaibacter acanthamoeba]
MTIYNGSDPDYIEYQKKLILNESDSLLKQISKICSKKYHPSTPPNALKKVFPEFFEQFKKDIKIPMETSILKEMLDDYKIDFIKFKAAVKEGINDLKNREFLNCKESFITLKNDKELKSYLPDFCKASISNMTENYICENEFIEFAISFFD